MKTSESFSMEQIKEALKASNIKAGRAAYDVEMESEFFFEQLRRIRLEHKRRRSSCEGDTNGK